MEDFSISISKGRFGSFVTVPAGEVRILQLTDIQIIDSDQMRVPDRLCTRERLKWTPDRVWDNAYRYVQEAIDAAQPHLIVITGDNVYGEFDDSGRQFRDFCDFFESLGIPWAPVFGNHDNESDFGVSRQCAYLESLPRCLFMRGDATGHGNYAVTLGTDLRIRDDERSVPSTDDKNSVPSTDDKKSVPSAIRTLLMLDSHGCLTHPGIRADQIELCRKALEEVREQCGTLPPLFACYHIPSDEFLHAAADAGYQGDSDYWAKYELGVTLPARNGDFGKRDDPQGRVGDNDAFLEFFKAAGGDGIFVGHYHKNCTSILSDGVRYTFGLKTGVYDYHNSDMIGGTLITLTGENGGAHGENGGAHDESGGAPGETADRPGFSVKHLYTRLKDDFWERLERAGE